MLNQGSRALGRVTVPGPPVRRSIRGTSVAGGGRSLPPRPSPTGANWGPRESFPLPRQLAAPKAPSADGAEVPSAPAAAGATYRVPNPLECATAAMQDAFSSVTAIVSGVVPPSWPVRRADASIITNGFEMGGACLLAAGVIPDGADSQWYMDSWNRLSATDRVQVFADSSLQFEFTVPQILVSATAIPRVTLFARGWTPPSSHMDEAQNPSPWAGALACRL
jgi:hypothetical protein